MSDVVLSAKVSVLNDKVAILLLANPTVDLPDKENEVSLIYDSQSILI